MRNEFRNDDDRFASRVREQLDADIESLDAATQAQLTRIRHTILAPRERHSWWSDWAPAGAFASALLAALLLMNNPARDGDPARDVLLDLDLITGTESLEMLEDLEFYLWLESDDRAS